MGRGRYHHLKRRASEPGVESLRVPTFQPASPVNCLSMCLLMMWVIDGGGLEETAVALIRYAAINVIRSRRRTLTAMIGVLLAVTFVSGTFIAIDSSTRATLDAFLATLPSDINFEARASANGTQLRQAVENITGVLRVAVTRFTAIGKLESAAASGPVDAQVIGVEPNRLPSALEAITLAP